MSNDPYQPQPQPYGQPVPPPPPYEQAVPQVPYNQPAYAQPPKKRRRWPWILGIILGVVVLGCAGSIAAVVYFVNNSPGKAVAQQYYDAIKRQDYATAYTFLDKTMTLTAGDQSQQISQDLFTQVGQSFDTSKGKVSDYSITSINVNSSSSTGSTTDITVHVTRSSGAYDVHLVVEQQGNDWKIVKFDNV